MASSARSADMEGSAYKTSYLDGAIPCQFPRLETNTDDTAQFTATHVAVADGERLRFLFAKDPELARTTISLAWALLVRTYTGQDDVSFAYMDTKNGESMVDIPVLRVSFEEGALLRDPLDKIRQSEALGPQCISSVSLAHLCNTALIFDNFVRVDSKEGTTRPLSLIQDPKQVCSIHFSN
jgi:hypothetical protein